MTTTTAALAVETHGVRATGPRNPRSFMPPDVWDREIQLLVRDHPWDTVMAERCLGQAVAYLITAMEHHGRHLEIGCGPLIDIAVHGFILDTVNYRRFCAEHFDGRFLEHTPAIEFEYDGTVERTAKIIAGNGFAVDWPLWQRDAAKCTPCHPGADCH